MAQTEISKSAAAQALAVRSSCIICVITVSETLLATVIFPFVYEMVGEFIGKGNIYIGFWAGLITSTYFISQTITSFLWGFLSDRVGRKPVLIFGLIGGGLGIILLGFSKSLILAIMSRMVCGFCNGNAGVVRTALGELAHNYRWNQGKTFSLFGLCSAIGYIIGPCIGGYLSNPAERYSLSGPYGWFHTYPYLLPCCIVGIYNLLAVALSFFLLEETRIHSNTAKIGTVADNTGQQSSNINPSDTDPLLRDPDTNRSSSVPLFINFTHSTKLCAAGLGLLSFHAVIFDETYPILASTLPPNGLGFKASEIGFTLSIMGPVVVATALLLFPVLSRRFSVLLISETTCISFSIIYILFSLLPNVKFYSEQTPSSFQVLMLCILMGLRFATNVVSYTSLGIILNQIAAPETRGAIMGFAQTWMSFGRSLGPAFGGIVWSWSLGNGLPAPFDFHLLYMLEALCALVQFTITRRISGNRSQMVDSDS